MNFSSEYLRIIVSHVHVMNSYITDADMVNGPVLTRDWT